MMTKAPLPEGEMWCVNHIEEAFSKYGIAKCRAYSQNEFEEGKKCQHDGWASEIEFYCSHYVLPKQKFVVWVSSNDTVYMSSKVLLVGRVTFATVTVVASSRWQQHWPHWPH